MNGLLLVAHGSRLSQSNIEISELTKKIEKLALNEFDLTACAFLQYTSPGIIETLEHFVELGITDITVFPYFIAAGRHVVEDILDMLEKFKKKHPQIDIRITGHLGSFKALADFIFQQIK